MKSKRAPRKEKLFRKDLIEAYGSQHDKLERVYWCPILHRYTAHIVYVNVGEVTARALFGEEQEHLWNVRNGLLINKELERLIDNGKAVILPLTNSPDENRFQFFLLTMDIGRLRLNEPVEVHELHKRELHFQTDFRPSKKYLYFKVVITLLRRRRGEVPCHLEDLNKLPSPARTLWVSPGPYLKKTILYKFSRQLGCLSVDEANRFWDVEASPLAPLNDDSEDLAATLSVQASLAGMVGPSKGNEASDDDNAVDQNSDENSEEEDSGDGYDGDGNENET